jgi:hypothetical protein
MRIKNGVPRRKTAKLSFNLSQELSTFSDLFIFLPFVGPISGVMAMVVFKIVPNQWLITKEGISIRGREFKTIKWNKINDWSISPIVGLEGYHVLKFNYADARNSESCIVINQSYPIERIEQRLTNCSTGPANSAGQ